MKREEAIETLDSIRKMMESTTRIMSLSGASAIAVGIYALAAVAIGYIGAGGDFTNDNPFVSSLIVFSRHKLTMLMILAALLIVACISTVVAMSAKRARARGERLRLDRVSLRLLWSFFMPLSIGAALCVILYTGGHWGLTSSIMLIFYGLSLVGISHYTYSDSRYLGYAEIILGLIDAAADGYAIIFWAIGFGVFHIIYGIYCAIRHR